jgi:general secretion pathway protein C
MNINYNSLFKFFIPYLIVVFVAYGLATVLYFYLPSEAKKFSNNENKTLDYKRFNIYTAMKQKKKVVQKVVQKVVKKQEYSLLTSIELIGIYAFSNTNGYIIMKEKKVKETLVLSTNEKFKDYTLKEVYSSYVVFVKDEKEYKVSMDKDKNSIKYDIVNKTETIKTTKSISIEDGTVTVKRELIDDYIKNFDKIWKDISISEVKTASGLGGFKVNRIRKNTPFAKIGLKKNDIIKVINNVELKNYNDAFKIYKKINTIKSINLVVLRDNIEMEIYYEIK